PFSRRGAAALGDEFDLVFVSGDTAHQPARNEQCSYHASTPAVVQVGIADGAAMALAIQKRDGALVDLVGPPTNRQTELGTLIQLLLGVCQWHSASRPVAIICLRPITNLDLERNLVVRELDTRPKGPQRFHKAHWRSSSSRPRIRSGQSGGDQMNRCWWARVGPVVVLAAIGLGQGAGPAVADETQNGLAIGDTTVFASVPAPGHPFGVAVDKSRVYVSTSAGDFFANPATGGHLNSDGERVFAYDHNGKLVTTTTVATMPNSNMGLFGLALDGNPTPEHQLYIADMHGRILRLSLDHESAAPVLFAQAPLAGGWMVTMWNDLVFDRVGNLFMTDD